MADDKTKTLQEVIEEQAQQIREDAIALANQIEGYARLSQEDLTAEVVSYLMSRKGARG